MGKYGIRRKAFALRVPVEIWESLEVLRLRHCRIYGDVSMNTWLESILHDKVVESADELRLVNKVNKF